MLQVPRWRVIAVILVTLLGLVYAAPNLIPGSVRAQLPAFLQQTINLGLDLRGGSSLLLEIDNAVLRRQRLENVSDSMMAALRDAEPRIFATPSVSGDVARVRLREPADMARAMQALEGIVGQVESQSGMAAQPDLTLTQTEDGFIEARLTPEAVRALARDAVQRSIEVIRRRIDPTGASEIQISRQGDDRISVQAPGESDPQILRNRIGQTALLTFHLVDDQADMEAVAAGRVPPSSMIAEGYGPNDAPELVRRRPSLTGENLTNARTTTDPQTGQYAISIQFDAAGARTFCRISTEYTGRRFAILLDNRVLTAPVFREPICGGSGQIDGSFNATTASELALLLRAGALPVPLTVVEQRSVGPGLGQDAIEAGQISTAIGFVLVLVFMVLAYGFVFGGISVIALLVNGVLIFAVMTVSGAALTVPGIAGLILTLAVALDANVLIYERMRDEVRSGRSPVLAAEGGFSRAIVTILDANITHLGAAIIMFTLGAGPVQGFAWTLMIGVFTSVFTAVLITQVMIAWWYRTFRPKRLPIA